MAKVHVYNVLVLDNPSTFKSKFEFEITFECLEDLPEDLEWKIVYVGSAESEEYDQVLDTVYVGPVPEGRNKFVFTADPPDPEKIPPNDVVGVTVILLTCAYRNQEFIRVGYYVSNEYSDPEMAENPPAVPDLDKLNRNILASNPRVTKFKINWESSDAPRNPLIDDENIPPIPNDIPHKHPDPRLESPMKTGLRPTERKVSQPDDNSRDSNGMDLDMI